MQVIAVLLLQLSQGATPLTNVTPNVSTSVDKLTRWLQAMMEHDAVSERAYYIVCQVRRKIERSTGVRISDQFLNIQVNQFHHEATSTRATQLPGPTVPTYPPFGSFPALGNPYPQSQPSVAHETFQAHLDPNLQFQPSNLDMHPLPPHPVEPQGNLEFGQEQMPLFYGNTFTSNFDQFLNPDLGSS